jgi:hypothetical protein
MNTYHEDRSPGTWMDRLVELHVLAEHGDAGALAEAQLWMGRDDRVRAAWETVARDCSELGGRQRE